MQNRGEIKIMGIIIGMLFMFLFVGMVAVVIPMLNNGYDTTGYDESDLGNYNQHESLSSTIQESQTGIDNAVVDRGLFDFLAGIFDAVLAPFKFIYRSYSILSGMTSSVVSDLNLLLPIKEFLITAIVAVVMVGIVMIKFYLGKQK